MKIYIKFVSVLFQSAFLAQYLETTAFRFEFKVGFLQWI